MGRRPGVRRDAFRRARPWLRLDSTTGVLAAGAGTAALAAVVVLLLPDPAVSAPLWTQVVGWPVVLMMRSDLFQRWVGGGRLDNRLLLRLLLGYGAFAAVLWPTGTAFLFPLFAALVATVHLSWSGARAWRAAVATMLPVTVLLQVSVHAGWQPTVLPAGTDAVVAVTVLVAALSMVGNTALLSSQREAAAESLELERRSRHDDLRHAATHDQLTGLLNRAGLFEALEQHVAEAGDDGPGPSLLSIDLDDFKPVNDEHGHAAGDRLLQLVAQRLGGLLRPGDRLSRLGGDEFIVVLAPPLDPAAPGLVASRAQRALEAPFLLPETVVRISASIGTAGWVVGTTSVDEQLHRADSAMYAVKARRPAGLVGRRG